MFRWISIIAVFVLTSSFILVVSSLFSWTDTRTGLGISITTAVILGLACGFLTYRFLWLGVVALGVLAGYYLGTLVYFIIFAIEKFDSPGVMLALQILFAIFVGIISVFFDKGIIIIGTSGIGAYLFTRGWSFILGGFPSETEIIHSLKTGTIPEISSAALVYAAMLGVVWLASMTY